MTDKLFLTLETPVSSVGNSSIKRWKLQYQALETPVSSVGNSSIKHKKLQYQALETIVSCLETGVTSY